LRESGLSNSDYGLLISLNGLAIVLLELPFTSITQRFRAIPTLAVSSLLVGLGFALNAWAETLAALAFTVVIWTIGEIVYAPVAATYVADIAPVHLRGRYQAAKSLTHGLAFMLGPGIGAALFASNGDAFWLLCGLLGVVSAGLVLPAAAQPAVAEADERPARDAELHDHESAYRTRASPLLVVRRWRDCDGRRAAPLNELRARQRRSLGLRARQGRARQLDAVASPSVSSASAATSVRTYPRASPETDEVMRPTTLPP
jgi:MFS family permease